jgi:hypothetical protein
MTAQHWIKRERIAHKRAMGEPMSTDSERAISYALWLAKRDGIALPDNARSIGCAVFERVGKVKRARGVRFGGIAIAFPHWDYVERGAVQLPDADD